MNDTWSNIREALPVEGKTIALVTCDDWEDVCREQPDRAVRRSMVYLHFTDGTTMGFYVTHDYGFFYDGHAE